MATYAYIARDAAGSRVTGQIDATSEQAVLTELQSRGLAPVRLSEARERRGRRVSTRRLATAYQQIADLLRAGVPLLRALRLLGRGRSDPTLAAVMSNVADHIAEGERLADAMARHQRIFPEVHIAMIRAGERGGFLDQVLSRLGRFLHHQAEMKSRVVGNLVYPVVLLVVGVGVVVAALIFFVPKFEDLYKEMVLPLPTRIVLATSNLLVNYWPFIIALLIVATVALLWCRRQPAVRRTMSIWQLKIPQVGSLVRSLSTGRFCRILGTMLENGIPLLSAMQIARDATGHVLLSEAVDDATEAVRGGESLAGPLEASGMFEADVIEMISVGESANNLPGVLITIAETIEGRVDRMLQLLLRLMEPLMLLILGLMVMFIFMALIVPMMQLSNLST